MVAGKMYKMIFDSKYGTDSVEITVVAKSWLNSYIVQNIKILKNQ